jgi:hypothetical protein
MAMRVSPTITSTGWRGKTGHPSCLVRLAQHSTRRGWRRTTIGGRDFSHQPDKLSDFPIGGHNEPEMVWAQTLREFRKQATNCVSLCNCGLAVGIPLPSEEVGQWGAHQETRILVEQSDATLGLSNAGGVGSPAMSVTPKYPRRQAGAESCLDQSVKRQEITYQERGRLCEA